MATLTLTSGSGAYYECDGTAKQQNYRPQYRREFGYPAGYRMQL